MELKLELINLSFEIGRERALQAMANICPGMLTGIPLPEVDLGSCSSESVSSGGDILPPWSSGTSVPSVPAVKS